jgi:hypothetical protein
MHFFCELATVQRNALDGIQAGARISFVIPHN